MNESFDYIIVGGGTSGLVVAARLSEDADVRVLVIEAGTDQRTNPSLITPGLIAGAYTHDGFIWPFKSVPQEHLNNRHLRQDTGKVLGGSSVTNFLMAMFPSRQNLDSWEKLGNKGWSFDDLRPYLKKFSTTQSPSETVREKLGGLSYYQEELSGDGPVQFSYDDEYNDVSASWFKTFANLGLEMKTDPRAGSAVGAFQNPSSIDHRNRTRSSAATAYYSEAIAKRPNLVVLTGTTVQKIATVAHADHVVATGVQVQGQDGRIRTIAAKREVILAAGALRSPQLLELSGIGDRKLLESLGIPVVVDNPNVGEHMQDHLMTAQQFPVRKGMPSRDALRDPELFQAAADEYAKTNKGLLGSMGVSAAYVPMADRAGVMSPASRKALFDRHLGQGTSAGRAREYALLRELLESPEAPAVQYMCFPGSLTVTPRPDTLTDMFTSTAPYDCIGIMTLLNHPFSRGSVHVVAADPAAESAPAWDPRYCSHPLDLEILARSVQFVERIVETAPFRDVVDPRLRRIPDVVADDLERARAIVRDRTVSCFHISGSCGMRPREHGGVVDPRLRVYGTANLRVVDASIFPLEPLGNIQTTVYAVAEKAADIIKEDRRAGASEPHLEQHRGDGTEHHLKVALAPFAIDQPLKCISSASSHRDRYLAFLQWIIHGRRDGERPDLRGRPRRSGGSADQAAQCRYLYEHFTSRGVCAKCGTGAASLQCAKCLVTEGGHPLVVTFYCSVGCQAADLCYHRQVCQPLKRFHRAACLARDLYARLAEATYVNGPVDTICADDPGLVHITRDPAFDRILRGDSMIVPFQRDRFDNPDHAIAALYDIHGPHQTQATSAGRSFLNMFIRTQCVRMREVHFRPKNAAFGYASTVPVSVGRGYAAVYSMLEEHGVVVATLRTGHEVVVDVAGAQFGWREPMALWHDYLRVRCQQITHETEAVGAACRAFRRAQGPHSPLAAVRSLRRAVMVRVVNEVMAWVLREHRSFSHFLRQPDATYRAAHDAAVAIAERVCAEELAASHRLGLFRLFRLFNGGVKVTRTWEEAAEMQEMWLTDEEIGQVDNEDPERRAIRLIDMYEHKVRRFYRDTGVDAMHRYGRRKMSMTADGQNEGIPDPNWST
ncbi:hypothetical protein F4775DRAFT_585580 [Biscogniauxia sp. FL1348]|nr:hypothetical protein F4775DRAFT_585580 [Biscogniauxia sp. FL1348]